jgi:5-methylthioadenosine/S-adenosylhomocysteine deaminase
MLADLLAVDLADPAYRPLNDLARQLVFAESGRGVRHVWVAGRHVVKDGRCTTVDEAGLMAEVESLMPAVRQDVTDLQRRAERLRPGLRRIMARAEAVARDEDRYLPN